MPTLPHDRSFRIPFGLDPRIIPETFAEVGSCRKAGIMINTFLPGRYVLLDCLDRKTPDGAPEVRGRNPRPWRRSSRCPMSCCFPAFPSSPANPVDCARAGGGFRAAPAQ